MRGIPLAKMTTPARTILAGLRSRCSRPGRFSGKDWRRGNVAILVAVSLVAVIGMAGLAVDSARLYVFHERLQAAVDAAVLAGCLQLPYDHEVENGKVKAAVVKFLKENYPDALVKSLGPGTEVRSVCLTAEASIPMTLMNVLGLNKETISASACGGFNNLEIAIAVDNSGSMAGSPINNTKAAAIELVDLIMPKGGSASSKVGLVAFKGKVRIGKNVDPANKKAGCRNADGSLNTSSDWNTCTRALPEALALSTDKDTINKAINSMDPGKGSASGTVISEGIKWATHILTHEAPFTEGVDPEEYPEIRKVLILLTDGDTEDGMCGGTYSNTRWPNAYTNNAYFGMGNYRCHCENGGCLNQAALDEAQKAKDQGIEIFTIRFGSSDSVDKQIMKTIASSKSGTTDHYYNAPSSVDIQNMFRKIGQQLGLRLLN